MLDVSCTGNLHTISISKIHCICNNNNFACCMPISLQKITNSLQKLFILAKCQSPTIKSSLLTLTAYLTMALLSSIFVITCCPMTTVQQWLLSSNVCVQNSNCTTNLIQVFEIIIESVSPYFMLSSENSWILFELEFMFFYLKVSKTFVYLLK